MCPAERQEILEMLYRQQAMLDELEAKCEALLADVQTELDELEARKDDQNVDPTPTTVTRLGGERGT